MAAPDKLRIGIIGIGSIAFVPHAPAIRATGRAELVAISRRNPEALAQAKAVLGVPGAYTDWADLLQHSRLDAVVVATSHSSHAAPTITALEMGLPVLVEKPMATTSEDAWAMVRAAERARQTLMVGYGSRLRGLWRIAKRLLDEGAIGTVEQVALAYGQGWRWMTEGASIPAAMREQARQLGIPAFEPASMGTYWRRDPKQMGGGHFADAGSHMSDLVLWLGGAPATTVVAFSEPKGRPQERYISATARLANGVIATVTGSNGTDMPARLTAMGDGGSLTSAASQRGGFELWLERGGKRELVTPDYPDLSPVAAFVAAVLDSAPNLSPAEDAAHVVEFTEAAYRSALEERLVRIEPREA